MQRFRYGAAVLIVLLGCTPEPPVAPVPGANLRGRVLTRIEAARAELRPSIGHYALVYDVSQRELLDFMSQIYPRRDGPDLVMAALGGIELHGGGVLGIVAALWQPGGREAELADVFRFNWGNRAIALQEIYDSMRMQLFLPVESEGGGKDSGQLPRMLVQHAARGVLETTELDAYHALALLLRYETDLHASWTNRLNQEITTAGLFDHVWDHYLISRSAEEEFADHSYLHLIEILIAYNRRLEQNLRRDPNGLKRRLLTVELERIEYGGYETSEALGHYVESLSFLLADQNVRLTTTEKVKIRAWLRDLEMHRLAEIDDVPVQHLAHLLSGLRRIDANADRLQ